MEESDDDKQVIIKANMHGTHTNVIFQKGMFVKEKLEHFLGDG